MQNILAIDPGNIESAYVVVNEKLNSLQFGKISNEKLLSIISELCTRYYIEHVAIEMIASYGMAVGKEVFETCVWIGKFVERIETQAVIVPKMVYRKDEKITLCGSMKAKDSNIRRALIDRFAQHDLKNGKGTKANPDWFYGFAKDIWAAYAVAVTYWDNRERDTE